MRVAVDFVPVRVCAFWEELPSCCGEHGGESTPRSWGGAPSSWHAAVGGSAPRGRCRGRELREGAAAPRSAGAGRGGRCLPPGSPRRSRRCDGCGPFKEAVPPPPPPFCPSVRPAAAGRRRPESRQVPGGEVGGDVPRVGSFCWRGDVVSRGRRSCPCGPGRGGSGPLPPRRGAVRPRGREGPSRFQPPSVPGRGAGEPRGGGSCGPPSGCCGSAALPGSVGAGTAAVPRGPAVSARGGSGGYGGDGGYGTRSFPSPTCVWGCSSISLGLAAPSSPGGCPGVLGVSRGPTEPAEVGGAGRRPAAQPAAAPCPGQGGGGGGGAGRVRVPPPAGRRPRRCLGVR